MILNVTLHARKVVIIKHPEKKNSTRKTSKATVVFSFCLSFGDGVLYGYLKWTEVQNVLSPCFP